MPALRVEPSPRWVRAILGGRTIVDSRAAMLVFGIAFTPRYAFPLADIEATALTPSSSDAPSTSDAGADRAGARRYFDLRDGDRVWPRAAWTYPTPTDAAAALAGHVLIEWDTIDQWFEEDEQVYVHPRDPYHRVDALRSSRHVQIVIGGQVVADSARPVLLFETGLPTRYYLPQQDVRMDLLEPSETVSECPYKGVARYWNGGPTLLAGGDLASTTDIAWSYPFPIPDCPRIEGHICFYDEQVDAVIVDGEQHPRPHTIWGE